MLCLRPKRRIIDKNTTMSRILSVSLFAFSLIPANAVTISQSVATSASTSWAGYSADGLGDSLSFEPFPFRPDSLTRVDFSLELTLSADVTDVNPFSFDLWADPNLFMTAQASSLWTSPLNFYAFGDPVSGESAQVRLAPGENASRQHLLSDSLQWTFTSLADLQYFVGDAPVGFMTGASLFSLSSYGGGNATLQIEGEITYHYDGPGMAASSSFFFVPDAGPSAVLLLLSAGTLTWFFRRDRSV